MSVKVRRTWHYGSQRTVSVHVGDTLHNALVAATQQDDMPNEHFLRALDSLHACIPYRDWSWCTFEVA